MLLGENVIGAGNQQGSYLLAGLDNPSETTRRAPSEEEIKALIFNRRMVI